VGHASEMANGGGVDMVLSVSAVPYLAGSQELLAQGLTSRAANETEAALKEMLSFDPAIADQDRLMVLDAQTSGGLLISCPKDRVEDLLGALHGRDAPESAVIGEVREAGETRPRVVIQP